jgi:hypothetical protein
MPWVGFEPTIPGFERAKRVDGLDRAATVISRLGLAIPNKTCPLFRMSEECGLLDCIIAKLK